MAEPEDKDWSPEGELDPAKLQAEGIKQLKRVADLAEEDKKERADVAKKIKDNMDQPAMPAMVGVAAFKRPSFSQISARLKRAWEETHRIAPEAPSHVQALIVQTLYHSLPDDEDACCESCTASEKGKKED